jgi:uncharacterized protein (TIGR03435 family)
MRYLPLAFLVISGAATNVGAQTPGLTEAQFEVISIKKNTSATNDGGIRSAPDGSFFMTNTTLVSIINSASPEPVRDVQGLPTWASTERYDIVAKAPQGTARSQQREMLRNMLIERFKVAGHVEQQERQTFALVLARSDRRLGPKLKPPSAQCTGPQGQLPPERQGACGTMMKPGSFEMAAGTMAQLAQSISGLAGGFVNDRTGLDGRFAVSLRYYQAPLTGPSPTPPGPDGPPEIFTALQEQLGLKLQPEKSLVPIFVIDHIERPTDN